MYDGLAIDVGRQKLYYADAATDAGKVGELSTDGTGHRVLINDVNSSPRAVVVDVENRCLSSVRVCPECGANSFFLSRQPRVAVSDLPFPAPVSSSALDSTLSSPITPHSFTASLKPTCFTSPSHHTLFTFSSTDSSPRTLDRAVCSEHTWLDSSMITEFIGLFCNNLTLFLSVNAILTAVSVTYLFQHLSLLLLSVQHSPHPWLPYSFTASLKPTCFTNPSHHTLFYLLQDWLHGLLNGPFLLSISDFSFSSLFFIFVIFGAMW